ncbi:MAG: 16S rRNA (adenine(1518)-N(6)/adenine(1519)-N(6))-dimethyltransferase RsmA [Burkholderiales bacterium]|nr:16S rRNA (adenine(1518)-N(6)/adenine(1519)-N(6))-dimethyltransferase RsmA [Burkholderiales bacterium]
MPPHRPRKRFGQHFLVDPRYVERIVAAVDPRAGQPVVEIGPGNGALTGPLIERAGHVSAIEIDRDLAAALRARFPPHRLTLVEGDALRVDFARFGSGLRIVGNLPYNISSPLLFRLTECITHVRDCHFMLQREVVERMAAPPGDKTYGRLSVMMQYWYAVERLFRVAPGSFRPAPQVDSAVVRLTPLRPLPHPARDYPRFARLVAEAFSHRRKTLRNALRDSVPPQAFEAAGIEPGLRPEMLGVADFVRLAAAAA